MTSRCEAPALIPKQPGSGQGHYISHSKLADLMDTVLSTPGLIVSPVTDLF